MTLNAGTHLGPYEILAPLGAGGMGEVYRARDTKLDRDVAIKVLPEAFARNPERVARFQREAKLLAALNHPNIAAVYGFDESDGVRFLVLELVEGETLAQRAKAGPLPVDEALQVGKQIAGALESAHESGVIHRDLKPSNVKVAPDGKVKVLDFGLAKALSEDKSTADLAHSPTITAGYTSEGVVLGTAAYMSPEQARGKPLDKRTDIWSFGCVMYECLTGQRPFAGETTSDVIAKILEHDPDYERLPHNTPHAIRSLLHHCLEKDRKQRLRDIGDAALELDEALATRAWSTSAMSAAAGAPPYERRKAAVTTGVVLALALGAAIGATVWHFVRPGPSMSVSRVSIAIPPPLKCEMVAQPSPDGTTLAWIARKRPVSGEAPAPTQIYTRRIDRYEVNALRGTEGAEGLTFSPDSRWLAFVAPISADSDRKRLAKVPVDGHSPPLTLSDLSDQWSSWMGQQVHWLHGGDIVILSGAGDVFSRVSSAGGPPAPARKINRGESTAYLGVSSGLPDDRAVFVDLYRYAQAGFQVGVGLLDIETTGVRVLIPDGSHGAYADSGHLLFSRGDTLLAAPFDIKRLEVTGGPVVITDGLRTPSSWQYGDFKISRNGCLTYAPGGRAGSQRRVVFVNEEGAVEPWSQERRAFEDRVSISRDGQRLAVVITSASGLFEVWTQSVEHPRLRRLAAAPDADCFSPIWSPDGRRVVYGLAGETENDGIYWRLADGSDEPELLVRYESRETDLEPTSWSPDGSYVLVERWVGSVAHDVLVLSLEQSPSGEHTLKPLLVAGHNQSAPDFSPDGQWIAYSSDETGRYEVYLRAFRGDATVGPAVPITTSGGTNPAWGLDGKTIFYQSEGRIMAVEITPEALPTVSAQPRVALDFDQVRGVPDDDYSVAPDGRLVVLQKGEDEDEITRFNVVLNLFEELKRRVPSGTNQ